MEILGAAASLLGEADVLAQQGWEITRIRLPAVSVDAWEGIAAGLSLGCRHGRRQAEVGA
jgi:hypothetical protein